MEALHLKNDIFKIESKIVSLLSNAEHRKLCLSVFLESIIEANLCGANKWGTYYRDDAERLRLLVGSLIVMTIQREGIWIALDSQLLQESKEEMNLLNLSKDWFWDTGRWAKYIRLPSKNGYYIPSKDHLRIWPIIKKFHFAYIDKAGKMFSQLREDSQKNHMPSVLEYLRHEFNRYVPEPIYEDSDSVNNPILDIQEYQTTHQYKKLTNTERKSIIQSRVGQGRFREELIRFWRGCAVTNCKIIEVLRASHIKPWRKSNNEERLDVFNGLLLVPNLDIAFDNGLISFNDDGKILISDYFTEDERFKLGVKNDMKILKIDQRHREYLKYHRENVFRNNRRK